MEPAARTDSLVTQCCSLIDQTLGCQPSVDRKGSVFAVPTSEEESFVRKSEMQQEKEMRKLKRKGKADKIDCAITSLKGKGRNGCFGLAECI
jgi:hypothetical protein